MTIRIKKRHSIEQETALLPQVIADSVCLEAATYLQSEKLMGYTGQLVGRAENTYAVNARWRRQLQRQDGRDVLYSFMRHWLAALLKKEQPRLFAELPPSFANGQQLPVRAFQ